MSPTKDADMIDAAIAEFEDANQAYATAREAADALEFSRSLKKDEAIRRLQVPSGDEKPLAYTAAERIVESDAEYAAHCKAIRTARYTEQMAWGKMVACQYNAKSLTRETV